MNALFDRAPDFSSRVGFAGNRIVRAAEDRPEGALAAAFADPAARRLVFAGGRIVLAFGADGASVFRSPEETAGLAAGEDGAVLLGARDGAPVLALSSPLPADALPSPFKALDLRSLHVQGLLAADDLAAVGHAASLLAFHAAHRFCGRCGDATEAEAGGVRRKCPTCATTVFPRVDPVAIMLAVRPGTCLLARGAHFPPGMFSCLAGFIEPGETLEDAVRRETEEESGLRIGRVAYHASQPWPFPHSLMIGCFAEALSEDIRRDERELEACRWFDRAEVAAMIAGTHGDGLFVPPPGAIATHLIRAWAENP